MISWKYSLEKINGELDLANKKKEALDRLLNDGRVSQHTYDSFSNEVARAIADIEAKQNALVEKMKTKIAELEQQMKTLEFLLVNSEIRHVSEEIEEETYNRESSVLSLGLETTKQELDQITEAISSLSAQDLGLPPSPPPQVEGEEAQSEPEAALETEPEVDAETEESSEGELDTETTPSVEETMEEQPLADEGQEEEIVTPAETFTEDEETTELPVEEAQETLLDQDTPVEEEEAETTEPSAESTEETFEASMDEETN